MRKFFLCWVLFSLGITWLAAQSITVTSPAAGATWCLGQPYTITWTSRGAVGATVSIRLRLGSTPIPVADTQNDGSHPWTVPPTLAPGAYTLLIRNADRTAEGTSTFTISACGAPPPASNTIIPGVIIPPLASNTIIPGVTIDPCLTHQNAHTDLVLEDVQFLWVYSGEIPVPNDKVRAYKYSFYIHNVGPRCITTLKWRMAYSRSSPNYGRADLLPYGGQYDSAKGQWVLRAGERKHFEGYLNWKNCCAGQVLYTDGNYVTLIKITVDPDNDIIETNEENNTTRGPGCTPDGYVILTYPDIHFCDRR